MSQISLPTLSPKARLASILLAVFVLGCSPRIDNEGHIAAEARLKELHAGTSTKMDVMNALGSPSTRSSFGQEEWYYISMRKETIAFLEPDIEKQDVVRFTFDSDGLVTAIDTFDKKDGRQVAIEDDRTPTAGHRLGFLEQVFGNIGRFNKSGDDTGPRTYGPTTRPR